MISGNYMLARSFIVPGTVKIYRRNLWLKQLWKTKGRNFALCLIEVLKVKFIYPGLCRWRAINTFEVQFTFRLVFKVWMGLWKGVFLLINDKGDRDNQLWYRRLIGRCIPRQGIFSVLHKSVAQRWPTSETQLRDLPSRLPQKAVYYSCPFTDRWSCHWLPGKMQMNTGLDPRTAQDIEVLQHLA